MASPRKTEAHCFSYRFSWFSFIQNRIQHVGKWVLKESVTLHFQCLKVGVQKKLLLTQKLDGNSRILNLLRRVLLERTNDLLIPNEPDSCAAPGIMGLLQHVSIFPSCFLSTVPWVLKLHLSSVFQVDIVSCLLLPSTSICFVKRELHQGSGLFKE